MVLLPEFDFATERTAELADDLIRMRQVGLLPELLPSVTASDLREGYLGRALRTALLDAIRWAQNRAADGKTDPPPDGFDPNTWEAEQTPVVHEDDYPQIEISQDELDWSEMGTSPGTPLAIRRKRNARTDLKPVTPTSRTLQSQPPPPPYRDPRPTVKVPPPLPSFRGNKPKR